MTTTTDYREPTYGNFQKPRSPGVYGQGLLGTCLLLVGVVAAVLTGMLAGYLWAVVVIAATVLVLVPFTVKIRGRSAGQYMLARATWWWGSRTRRSVYRSGALSAVPHGGHRLPGLLAKTVAHEFVDGHERRFVLLEHPTTWLWTLVIHCQPQGTDLVDDEALDHRVNGWAGFLSALGRLEGVAAAQQVVELVPDPGSRLHAEVDRLVDPAAPQECREELAERADRLPRGQALLSSRTSISWSTPHSVSKRKAADRPQAMAEFVAGLLPSILASLAESGAGVVTPLTADELADELAMAYDPAVATEVELARIAGERSVHGWSEAGPVGAAERWDRLVHDSGTSVTWSMTRPPLGVIWRSSLAPLFAPDKEITRKRVCLTYRPMDAETGRTRVRRDMRSALFKIGQSGVTDVDDQIAVDAHQQTERALAQGAILASFSMHVTATVAGDADLDQAIANVESTSRTVDVRLRRCWGHQAAAFSAALGVGVVLPKIVRVPQGIRDNL